jgi:predicted nucleotidyltransferase
MTKEQVVTILRRQYSYLVSEYGIKRIGIFGSYAKGTPTEESDIDIVTEFEIPIGLKFIELAGYLEQILGQKVDILTPVGIQGIRNPRIAKEIQESIVYV